MTTAAAGWFPDPAGRDDRFRWWDGTAWTRFLAADPALPDPALPDPALPDPKLPDPEPETLHTPPAGAAGPTRRPRPMPPGYEFGRPVRRGPRSLVVPIVIAVAVGALAVVIAVQARSQSADLLAPPPPVSTVAQRVTLSYDETSGVVTMPSLKVTVPQAPFTAERSDFDIFGIFSDSVTADTVVQHYGKDNKQSWIAVVDTGVVEDKLVGKDPQTTAENAFDAVVKTAFGPGVKATVKNRHSAALADMPDKVWIVNGDVHYHVKGVRSTYDRVNLMAIDVGSGHYVGWLSDRPNASAPAVKQAIDASIKTMRVTSR